MHFVTHFLRYTFRAWSPQSIVNASQALKAALKVGSGYSSRRLSDLLEETDFHRTE